MTWAQMGGRAPKNSAHGEGTGAAIKGISRRETLQNVHGKMKLKGELLCAKNFAKCMHSFS